MVLHGEHEGDRETERHVGRKLGELFALIGFGALLGSLFWLEVGISAKVPPQTPAPNATYESAQKKHPTGGADDRIAVYTGWLALFTALLAVTSGFEIYLLIIAARTANETAEATNKLADAAAGQHVVMNRQAVVMEGQLKAATRSADALAQTERAVLFVVYDNDNVGSDLSISRYDRSPDMVAKIKPGAHYRFRNYGKTPAILKEIGHNIEFCDELSGIPTYVPIMNVLSERALAASDQTIQFICRDTFAINGPTAKKVVDGGPPHFWFYGRVSYDDIFGNPHCHRFLFQWDRTKRRFAPSYDERYCEDT